MSKIIDKFSMVHDGIKDMWILCKNEDIKSTVERIDSQYDDEEIAKVESLREFIACGNLDGGEYLKIEGAIFEQSIEISADRCVDELEDCFEDWFTDEEINELLKGETCMYIALWDKMTTIAKQFAIDELKSMLQRAMNLNTTKNIWS